MKTNNRGWAYKRTEYVPYLGGVNKEKVFADMWENQNEPVPYLNHGCGTLQDLFIRVKDHAMLPYWPWEYCEVKEMSGRDRMIVATVVQWLGSNCGFDFLRQCLEKCGYKLTQIEDI